MPSLLRPTTDAIVSAAPTMPMAVGIAAGVVVDRAIGEGRGAAWIGAIVAAIGLVAIEARTGRRLGAALLLFVAVGGNWHHYYWTDRAADDVSRSFGPGDAARPAWLRGVAIETPVHRPDAERPGGLGVTRTVVEVAAISDGRDWHRASGRLAVAIGGDRTDLEPGLPIEMAGSLGPIDGPKNPGERDARDSWRAEGVRLRLSVDSPDGVRPDPSGSPLPWHHAIGRVRRWSHRKLVEGLSPDVAPLASALLLGRREAVDPDLNDAFARTGTTHLLAISGLHLQALALLIFGLTRVLGVRRRRAMVAVMVGSTAYAVLVGLAPSVARSLAMTLAACLAGLVDRPDRPGNLMAAAMVATLGLNPADLFDVGCQLSFLAVAAILWGVPPVMARLRGEADPLDRVERQYEPTWKRYARSARRWLVEGLVVSTVVWLVAVPLTGLRFHLTSPIGILLNVPLVPITTMALVAAGASLGLSALWGPLGLPAAWACRGLLTFTDGLVRWGAAQGWGSWFGPGPAEGWAIAFYLALGAAATATALRLGDWPRRSGWVAVGACALAMIVGPWMPRPRGEAEAHLLAVGHGLAVVVRSGDGRAFLYDAGRMGDPRVGRRLIAPALWAMGVSRLDAVVLSHADSDHYNGLPDLLDRVSIGAVLVPEGFGGAANPGAVALLDRVRSRGIPIRSVSAGMAWGLGSDVRVSVVQPGPEARAEASDNARSVVLDVESSGRRLLLTGDLEGVGLTDLVGRPATRVDAMLAPHHGGRKSNPGWLYDWAAPGLVVSSQSPTPAGARDALGPIEARAIPVWRTWERGAVRLRWTAGGLAAGGFLDEHRRAASPSTAGRRLVAASLVPAIRPTPALIAAAGLVAGLLGAGLLAVVEWGAWILVTPGRPLALPADDPYPGEPIHVTTPDGLRLAGTWHGHPDAEGRTLLLLHGLAEQRQTMRARADGVYAGGWNVAVLDSRAYGDSGGSIASFGGREVDDLRRWLDLVADRVGPAARVAVWGRSMGAGVAIRAAAIDPRIKVLVLEAPYIDLHGTAATLIRRYRIPAARPLASMILRRARRLAGVSLHLPRPIDAAPKVTIPVLILRGTSDALVSDAETARLAATLAGPVDRIEVPGARHSKVLDVGGPDLLARVRAFLDARI